MKVKKIPFLIVALAAASLAIAPEPASALFGLFNTKETAPPPIAFPIQNDTTFAEKTSSYHDVPFSNPAFEYDIRLPTDWTVEQMWKDLPTPTADQAVATELTRFKSPMMGTHQANVSIKAMRLGHEISVDNWLKNYIKANNYTPQEPITLDPASRRASSTFVSTFETRSILTYLTAQMNGDIVIIAQFDIPLQLKAPLAFLQKKTIDSFRLIMPVDTTVEQSKSFTLGDAIRFSYPQSWEIRYPDTRNPDNVSVQLYNRGAGGKIDGVIRINAVRRSDSTNLENEMAGLRKYFDEFMNIRFRELTSSTQANVSDRFIFSRAENYMVSGKNTDARDQEVRLAVLGDKDWYVSIFLLTQAENVNFTTWARNTETFNLIMKSLR